MSDVIVNAHYYLFKNFVKPPEPVKFSSPTSFTIKRQYDSYVDKWDGTIEYSTDNDTWTVWNGNTTLIAGSDGTDYNLYFRGSNNTTMYNGSATSDGGCWVISGSNVSVSGDLEYLLDYSTAELGQHPVPANDCFAYWLKEGINDGQLVSASGLHLTTNVSNSCYDSMFYNCVNLENSPRMSATTLAYACYTSMFEGCTSLITPPILPATALASFCYYRMFRGCTSLVTAPALPALTLAETCYYMMFSGCTSLVTAPALPATTLATNCYHYMFRGCTSLVTAPALPATTLATNCYQEMFDGCTALVTAPALPATTLATNCYKEMFYGCTSLETMPALTITADLSVAESMFYNCSKIKVSNTQTGDYQNVCVINSSSTDQNGMFANTGGTHTGSVLAGSTYYTSNTVV